MPFLTDLQVIRKGPRLWRLTAPLVYQGREHKVTVPEGFVTDLLSMPWPLSWWWHREGTCDPEAVLHDYLYAMKFHWIPRRDADGLFRKMLKEKWQGETRRMRRAWNWCKRWLWWAGLRVGGWARW